jgi:hypothetical protein
MRQHLGVGGFPENDSHMSTNGPLLLRDRASDRMGSAVRLEMTVGFLFDQLHPAKELVEQLQLRANASHVSRSDLKQQSLSHSVLLPSNL